jgi:hypothetical protein
MSGREIGGCAVACCLQTARPNGACAFVRYGGERGREGEGKGKEICAQPLVPSCPVRSFTPRVSVIWRI